ncbi:MAG: amino acid permease [Erysipelotrichaceae bacterium]
MENQQTRKFGLLTTSAMIVGIVIGSGIFFKTDNILKAVNGSVMLGVLAWIVGGIGIIFGGLTIAVLAKRDEHVGGLITYCEMTWGKTLGYLAGWFQIMFYYPALVAVVSWVAAMYLSELFGWTAAGTFFGVAASWAPAWTFPFSITEWILTLVIIAGFFTLNSFATKAAGKFQSFAMIVKVSALFILAITGLTFGNPVAVTHFADAGRIGAGFFAALVPIAFAFDGWQVAPSIAHEIKNPKRNLPLALTFAPLLIMLIYIAYFVGLNAVLGPDKILSLGDNAVSVFAQQFFGNIGYRVVLVGVVLSVLGTSNGLILGYIRLPYALGLRGEMFWSKRFSAIHPKFDIPLFSSLFCLAISLFWLALHFAGTTGAIFLKWTIFNNLAVDELSIVLIYIFMILIYFGVIKEFLQKKVDSWVYGILFPVLAIVGASTAVYGGFLSPMVAVYLIVSILGIIAGLLVKPRKAKI